MTNDKKIKDLEEKLKKIKKEKELQDKELENTKEELKTTSDELVDIEKSLDDVNDELIEIQKDIENKNEEIKECESNNQRLRADFDNFSKQTEKQKQDIIKFANENLIINILDVYEDFDRVLTQSKDEKELREGVELIYSKLKSTLEKEGLEEIPAKGEKFDYSKHEALMAEDNEDFENGEIIDELMKGYTLKDKVIKYSKVKVCKK